jgi:hypothetical protein
MAFLFFGEPFEIALTSASQGRLSSSIGASGGEKFRWFKGRFMR